MAVQKAHYLSRCIQNSLDVLLLHILEIWLQEQVGSRDATVGVDAVLHHECQFRQVRCREVRRHVALGNSAVAEEDE